MDHRREIQAGVEIWISRCHLLVGGNISFIFNHTEYGSVTMQSGRTAQVPLRFLTHPGTTISYKLAPEAARQP